METKIKIMNSTFELFSKNGTGFSLTEVAEDVGIKKASIYAHFENKDMLINKVIENEIEKYFFEINQEKDDLKRIFFGVLNYYNDSQTKLLFWKRLLLFPPESIDADLLEKIRFMSERRYEIVGKLISKEIKSGIIKKDSTEEINLMFFSLIHGLLSSILIYQPQDIKEHFYNIWYKFWDSITN
jgi:AcrR family transcriptional regulator